MKNIIKKYVEAQKRLNTKQNWIDTLYCTTVNMAIYSVAMFTIAGVKMIVKKVSEKKDEKCSLPDNFFGGENSEQNKSEEDSIIQHVPIHKLERIINVVHAKYGYITRKLVATEYKESYDKVYKYLDMDATEMTNVKPDSTDYERE